MTATTAALPVRRLDLIVSPLGDTGAHVVKDPRTGTYYNLGDVEVFLLNQLDGRHSAEAIRAAYEERFDDALSDADLAEFLELVAEKGFLAPVGVPNPPVTPAPAQRSPLAAPSMTKAEPPPKRAPQSILYWRRSVFDPDRVLNVLAPRLSFLWTRGFFTLSLCFIAAAGAVLAQNWQAAVVPLPNALTWQTLALVYLVVIVATTFHEFAHGLTCKHYGGEVHEMGLLLIFFTPAFYCNVSDAWLIPQKSKRLWVTLAGAYCDLCVWALAVFVWRVTPADFSLATGPGLLHHLAWVTFTVCGTRVFINFNPLIKLDGYYLLGDWLEITNLRKRSWEYLMGHIRRICWGAPPPAPEKRAKTLLAYGAASWLFSMFYVSLLVVSLTAAGGKYAGAVGIGAGVLFGALIMRNLLRGFSGGEIGKMVLTRYKRAIIWGVLLIAAPIVLTVVPMEDRVTGAFLVRPGARVELRSPVSGFLAQVHSDEGDRVYQSRPLGVLEIPDLESRVIQKRAEIQEAKAKLRLLEAGPRPEAVTEQRLRVERAANWAVEGRHDLKRAKEALKHDLDRLAKLISQWETEVDYATYAFRRDEKLFKQDVLSQDQWAEKKKAFEVADSQLAQARAQRLARETLGAQEAAAELGRREKEEAEARAVLTLLEVKPRAEEVDAATAHLNRLEEELHYLEGLQHKVQLTSPLAGIVVTPRMKEKVGQYFKEGDPICIVEDPDSMEVEVALEEQFAARVRPGQEVDLKVRAMPFETLHGTVTRVANNAVKEKEKEHTTVTVYCRLEGVDPSLLTGMTGTARIRCGERSTGEVLLDRAFRYLRTEFWW